MGTKKTTTKKSPTGAPLGNPLKFFREGGEKRKAMFKNGGYNVPKNSLPKKFMGGPGDELTSGPLDENTSKYLDARYPGRSNKPTLEKSMKYDHERILRTPGLREDFNAGPMYTKEDAETVKPDSSIYKRGGSAKRKK